MQVKDIFIDVALRLPTTDEGDLFLGQIVRYLKTGEEPKDLPTVQRAVWIVLSRDLERSRQRIVADSMSAERRQIKREPISPRTRYEVFERDGYTCQYCGAKAPNVELHVDHIVPVSKGGTNDLSNLVTACAECNLGKSNLETTKFTGEEDG